MTHTQTGISSLSDNSLATTIGPSPSREKRGAQMNFREFCNETSLHGWQYLNRNKTSKSQRSIWILVVLFAMIAAGTFLYNNTVDYVNSNVITTVDTMTAPLSEVYFPSVVVCNINQIRESFIERENPHRHHHLEVYNFQESRKGENRERLILGAHQNCEDMFIYSKKNGSTSYDIESRRNFGTDYGTCCWFTPQFNFTLIDQETKKRDLKELPWGSWFNGINVGAQTGKHNGYTLLLDIESFDYNTHFEGSEGLKVAVVHHLDMPIMKQIGFHVAPGTESQIAVTPTLISTSESALSRFPAEERNCYRDGEISLKFLPYSHGYRYEMSNCLFEASFEAILEICGCYPKFHSTFNIDDLGNIPPCQPKDNPCVNQIMNKIGQYDHVESGGFKVKCRSNCEDQINSLLVTASAYPNKSTFPKRKEFCIVVRRILNKCQSNKRIPLDRSIPGICETFETSQSLLGHCFQQDFDKDRWVVLKNKTNSYKKMIEDLAWKYSRKNLAMLNIFIKDPYAKRFLKEVKITRTSYIAKLGSILGLCMGFSLISAAEIVFHVFAGISSALFLTYRKCVHSEMAQSAVNNDTAVKTNFYRQPRSLKREKIRKKPVRHFHPHDGVFGIERFI